MFPQPTDYKGFKRKISIKRKQQKERPLLSDLSLFLIKETLIIY